MAVPIPANQQAMMDVVAHDDVAAAALSITQRYGDGNALLCLLDRLGCGYSEKFRILHNGFDSVQTLVDHYGDDIDGFLKQLKTNNKNWATHPSVMMRSFFTPIVIGRLVGVLHYMNSGINILHKIPDINEITRARATSYNVLYSTTLSNEDNDEAGKVIIPSFSEVKGWMSFKENFLLFLGLIKGAHGIALDYVVDTTERIAVRANAPRPEITSIALDEPNIFKEGAVHFGDSYKLDNKAVWNKLHTSLVDQPAYNHINTYAARKNGRGAWLSLIIFYEGEDFRQRLRETAFTKLQTTFYRGETNRFSFEKYINIYKECHKMLRDAGFNNGAGLDQESMITYFRNGIKPDAGLEVSISNSRSNPRLSEFDALISFFTAEVQHNTLRRNQLRAVRDRKVAAAGKDPGNTNRSQKNKNKNKNKNTQVESEVVDGKRVEGRWYSKEEFGKFTPAQRYAVIRLKRKAKTGDKSVAAIRQSLRDDLVTLGDAIISGVAHASADNNNANKHEGDHTPSSSNASVTTRQSAESGSIGNVFRNRKRRREKA